MVCLLLAWLRGLRWRIPAIQFTRSRSERPFLLSDKLLDELRKIALSELPKSSSKKEIKTSVTIRSEAIKIYALKRAGGICEGCGNHAPFSSRDGPFLEVHHIDRMADGGPDQPKNVAALCPNCHRRVHHAIDGEEYNQQIRMKIRYAEKEHA
jgi:5-methylcytosine-specific restriction protein A